MTVFAIAGTFLSASLVLAHAVEARVQGLSLAIASGREPAAAAAATELRGLGPAAIRDIVAVGARLEGSERGRLISSFSSGWHDVYDALYEAGLEDQGYPMDGDENRMWQFAIEAAAALGPEATRMAVEVVARGRNDEANSFASSALVFQGRQAEPALIPLLDSPNPDVRRLVAGLLGQARDSRAVDALLRLAAKPEEFARLPAIEGLTRLREPRVLPIALRAIYAADNHVREAAAAALARLQLPGESRVALAFLARVDRSVLVRDTAAGFLRDTREPVSVGIGQRYDPVSTSPAASSSLSLRRRLCVIGSMAFVAFVAFSLNSVGRQAPTSRAALSGGWTFAILLVGTGWVWGRWVNGIYWLTEYEFMGTTLVAVVAARIRLGRTFPSVSGWVRHLWMGQLLLVLVGYLLGWMQLWGWSFEWLGLFRLWQQSLELAGRG